MSRQERIYDYVEQIQQQVQRARSEYSRISQSVDSSFAARALDSKEDPPSVGELRENFAELLELHGELLATGLAGESPGILMRSGALSKAERRMVAVFLEDWRAKLQPLLPINEKLKMLQEVVGSKLYDKRLRLDENGRLHVETTSGWEVPVEKLSSGEQHLLALFAMLIFTASIHSVVLVDEPEISLHAEWKHAFLDDIRRVADSSDLHFVLATHSTGIINGQWDLVEELEPA
jgi:ABC-type transport system involved in cytochrome c biogenesis ATPase subunit